MNGATSARLPRKADPSVHLVTQNLELEHRLFFGRVDRSQGCLWVARQASIPRLRPGAGGGGEIAVLIPEHTIELRALSDADGSTCPLGAGLTRATVASPTARVSAPSGARVPGGRTARSSLGIDRAAATFADRTARTHSCGSAHARSARIRLASSSAATGPTATTGLTAATGLTLPSSRPRAPSRTTAIHELVEVIAARP